MSFVGLDRSARLLLLCSLLAAGCAPEAEGGPEVAVTRAELSVADCPAGTNIIQGSNSANTLNGTAGDDCILGYGGSDTINGLGGNDFLIGGLGGDYIYGGDGNDTLHGEDGADRLYGEAGDDSLYGSNQVDLLYGGDGNDSAHGGAGNDTVEGDLGADVLYGGDGADTMRGGDGNDRIFGEAAADQLYGDGGDDIMDGGPGGDTMLGGSGHDVIQGGTQNDNLQGEDGNDAILGGGGSNTVTGGNGTDRCTGSSCELAEPAPNGCAQDSQCVSPQTCVVDIGVCLPCAVDADGDGSCDGNDGCPSDPAKTAAGICGCGVADTDGDGDGTANCNDGCPSDASKVAAGICGCGVSDADGDGDGTANCNDGCPADASKIAAGICGCGVSDADTDADGTADCNDGCPADASKIAAGICGCGVADTDSDSDGSADCNEACDADPEKTEPLVCGCGVAETDSDSDGTPDCIDPEGIPCVAGASGPGIYDGNASIGTGPGQIAIEALDGMRCVTGELYISNTELTDLSTLSSLRTIGGSLALGTNGNLTSLSGLEDLTSIGGSLYIVGNSALTSLEPLTNLESVGASAYPGSIVLNINDNASLPACWTWLLEDLTGHECQDYGYPSNVDCSGNTGTGSCGELPPDFECVPGASGPGVYDGWVNIDPTYPYSSGPDIADLGGVTCITGSVYISNTELTDLSALSSLQSIGEGLALGTNVNLTSLSGLEDLTSIGGSLYIDGNSALTSLEALTNLESLGANAYPGSPVLNINDNASLPACWTWLLEDLTGHECQGYSSTVDCSGNHGSGSCGELPPDFECVPGASGPGVYDDSIFIADGGMPPYNQTLEDFGGVTCITGSLNVYGETIDSLSALSSLEMIGGSLYISDTESLATLAGLENLTSIGGTLYLSENAALTSLEPLTNLESLGATAWPGSTILTINDNASLPACWTWLLEDLTGHECQGYSSTVDCSGNHGSGSCGELPPDFECVPGASGPGVYDDSIYIADGSMPPYNEELADFGGVTCITGSLNIWDPTVTDLSPLGTLEMIGDSLYINGNDSLTSLADLENLHTISNTLYIYDNAVLASLEGLLSLSSLGANADPGYPILTIYDNAELPACWVALIEANTSLECSTYSSPECTGNDGAGSCN
jgi:hypothetical protein